MSSEGHTNVRGLNGMLLIGFSAACRMLDGMWTKYEFKNSLSLLPIWQILPTQECHFES